MKVYLSAQGCLTVHGESTVESFALKAWYDMWEKKQATFLVHALEVKDSELAPTMQTINPI